MDAMEFFKQSAGKWRSQRVTHHLPFRRAESGGSEIFVEALDANNPKVVEICKMHDCDPTLAVGGAFVSWNGSMAWDKEDENHEGTTIFSLIPDPDNPKKGKLLRERGYAEIIPVAGQYEVGEDDSLLLITEYESMNTTERFWFPHPNLRLRTSTVTRFGGFSTATFCAEIRLNSDQNGNNSQNNAPKVSYSSISGW